MGKKQQSGFTIIEVILFLAISGGLLFALLIGVNSSIGQQRYRDSVVSLVSKIQAEYLAVQNTSSVRNSEWSCSDGDGVIRDSSGGVYRGATDCLLIGRIISVSGNVVRSSDIVAYALDRLVVETQPNDIAAINNGMKLMVMDGLNAEAGNSSEYVPEWGARLKSIKTNGTFADQATIAVLRSPKSGTVLTFVDSEKAYSHADSNLQPLISNEALGRTLRVCVVSANPTIAARRTEVLVVRAGSQNGLGVSSRLVGTEVEC